MLISQGEFYIQNFTLNLSLKKQTLANIFVFNSLLDEEGNFRLRDQFYNNTISIKLFHTNNKLYILDNYVRFKKFDILLYINNNEIYIYLILNISDSQIYYKNLTSGTNIIFEDNTILNFLLPYQPFDIYYLDIQNDIIQNIKINWIRFDCW